MRNRAALAACFEAGAIMARHVMSVRYTDGNDHEQAIVDGLNAKFGALGVTVGPFEVPRSLEERDQIRAAVDQAGDRGLLQSTTGRIREEIGDSACSAFELGYLIQWRPTGLLAEVCEQHMTALGVPGFMALRLKHLSDDVDEITSLVAGIFQYLGRRRVFLSYRRDGGSVLARLLWLYLTQRGFEVFLDVEDLREPRFGPELVHALEESDVVVPVLTASYFDGCGCPEDWIRKELDLCIGLGKPMVPVIPEGIHFQQEQRSSTQVRYVMQFSWCTLRHVGFAAFGDELCARIDSALGTTMGT